MDPLDSTSRAILDPTILGDEHYDTARGPCSSMLQTLQGSLQDIIAILGHGRAVSAEDKHGGRPGPQGAEVSCRQPFHVAEVFTGMPGVFVTLEDTIKGFKGICAGEYDHLPEAAFYMLGAIEDAVEKAKKMAVEAA